MATMDVPTAAAALLIQSQQLNSIATNVNVIAQQIMNIASEENMVIGVDARIKAQVAAMNIQITAITSQTVLVQQALDDLAAILK